MTRITVELHRRDHATVITTPSLVERLIGRRSTERCAFLVGGRWCWLSGERVTGRAERLLVDAHRDLIVARATAPPS